MKKERDILKSLLLKEELDLLDELNKKLLSKDQFTKEVSDVLTAAIIRAQNKNGQFERALSGSIKTGVKRAFSDNKQSIIDALLPIMGQLIRKSVTNSIKQFVTDINRTLELGFSTKALKWRWQAYKSGTTFAEIVFQKTIRYQIEELFLVNKENGLLIEHVGKDDMLKDNNAISAMLTVIQDFIGDSLQAADSDLLSAEIGDNLILISTGPSAFLAAVVKGSPTERLKERLQKLIENIHADFSDYLIKENLYRNIPDLSNYLRSYLITKNISEDRNKTNWWPWIITILLIVSGFSYWTYNRKLQYNNIFNIAKSIDGLYLQSIKRENSTYQIEGLLDPLADISSLNNLGISLKAKPFISLDSKIVSERINIIISNYNGVEARLMGSTAYVSGLILTKDSETLLQQLKAVPGVDKVDSQLKHDISEELEVFMQKQQGLLSTIDYRITKNKLQLSGDVDYKNYTIFNAQFMALFPDASVDSSAIEVINSTENLIKNINQSIINITTKKNKVIAMEDDVGLNNIIKSLQSIIARGITIHTLIIGHSDCQGTLSNQFSLKRADRIRDILIQKGINQSLLSTKIINCDSFNSEAKQSQLNVTFKVEQQ